MKSVNSWGTSHINRSMVSHYSLYRPHHIWDISRLWEHDFNGTLANYMHSVKGNSNQETNHMKSMLYLGNVDTFRRFASQKKKLRGCNGFHIKWGSILFRGWVLTVGLNVKITVSWKILRKLLLQYDIPTSISPALQSFPPILVNGYLFSTQW